MIRTIAVGAVLLVTSLCSMAAACPMCRDAAAINGSGGATPPGGLFNASVLCILTVFLLALTFLIFKIAHAIRSVNCQMSV
jgi:hypothetical protein